MSDFKLSASLKGHDDDVRSVAYPEPNFVVSASRDATVRLWKLLDPKPPSYDSTISSHTDAFVNAVSYFQPTSQYPDGLIVSGGKNTIIEVKQPGKSTEDNADALLLGHDHNVCSLDISQEGGWIVSGSWDSSARIWRLGKWECDGILEGHQGSVWAVLAYDRNTIITGMSKGARILQVTLLRTIRGTNDVVRALCRCPENHPSGGQFASAGNDGVIRFWTLDGRQVNQLNGHESFIYSIAVLPTGEVVSSGEDRTVRIWRGGECVQTITHPAISVWSVAVCAANGDIVSGASDRLVRIFTRDPKRYANEETLKEFEDAVKGSAIPQQQVGGVNKEKLPGPEFLQMKSGTKEGQVAMIREDNGSVTAHQWSMTQQKWISVGTVVDAVGSSGKKQEYLGQDYDYVFDVDIEDGKPPLKLPYNLSQNPYEAATKFIQDNELPIGYLDQVANFITTNTKGATLGQGSQPEPPSTSDPWGQENRYRPGEATSASASSLPPLRPKVLPQTSYLSITTASLNTIHRKIGEINTQLIKEGHKDGALNPPELQTLASVIQFLESHPPSSAKPTALEPDALELIIKLTTAWPPQHRIPGLDLLRLVAAATPSLASYKNSHDQTIVSILEESGVFSDTQRPNNMMLAIRTFANMFSTDKGAELADAQFDTIISNLINQATKITTNRNLTISITTLYINYAVLLTTTATPDRKGSPASIERGRILLKDLVDVISRVSDSEALYRALVAAGTLLTIGPDVKVAAKQEYGIEAVLKLAEQKTKEPRIKGVVGEIRELLP
ncbi:MAG: hypothetical protein M1834_003141 [Cirrosporium novae-zelandiae]|nr:MAG: hypothetical protein M1834_003141 [Cirrosporium novae-zelandiae]